MGFSCEFSTYILRPMDVLNRQRVQLPGPLTLSLSIIPPFPSGFSRSPMSSHKSFFLLALCLAPGIYAAPERNCKRALQARATPVTVTNTLPTKSIVSPEDAQCTVTYTTALPSLCTNAAGVETGVSDHTYTMTFGCDGSAGSPCVLPASPEACPPGFKVTTTVCDTCAGGPVTYTLTVPDTAAATATGQASSGKPHGASGSEHDISAPGEAGKPKVPGPAPSSVPGDAKGNAPASSPETHPGASSSEGEQPEGGDSKGDNVGGTGANSGSGSVSGSGSGSVSGSGETVGVSAASSAQSDILRAVEILLVSAIFVGINM
ncbi:hypothetical protein NLU13_1373 [Sarocladium strictum]|uniref:Uncharacterized protein n=1 Tax=Sarocladium strictum TaxID=5046 RepID=A0AA39GQV2_SARSR|nr:hypothetical protein NLU13_1373 [Sarocladium strictum]